MSNIGRWITLAWVGCFGLAATGCGESGPKLYSVEGTITINGQPGSGVSVGFVPADNDPSKGGTGLVKDGKYTVFAQDGRPGLLPGKYKITLAVDQSAVAMEDMAAKYKGPAKGAAKSGSSPTPEGPKGAFPEAWKSPATTPLEVTVETKSNNIPIDVK